MIFLRYIGFQLFTFLLFTSPVFAAAVAYDAVSSQTGVAVFGLSQTHTFSGSSNTLLLCGIGTTGTGATVSSPIYNSVALTPINSSIPDPYIHGYYYYIKGQSGSHLWSFTIDAEAPSAAAGCISLTDVDQTTPLGADQVTDDEEIGLSITVPTNGLGVDLVLQLLANLGCLDDTTAGGGTQTERFDACADGGIGATVAIAGSTITSTQTMSWGGQSGAYSIQFAVPVNPVAAAAAASRRIISVP